ncbi:hypothetical protein OPV22_017668 [Ensete ventricosum]|uniref:non-specific serine/threonine protein kinase n=1 Tax=Ensete ventricosum TaxID=4639 RepID=A0AAV8QWV9_ENSVE|nr:hypothetical protein OPV22_017668 [Ensete ventricosum]
MAPPELNLLHNALMLAFVTSLLPDLPLDMAADGTPIGSSSTSTVAVTFSALEDIARNLGSRSRGRLPASDLALIEVLDRLSCSSPREPPDRLKLPVLFGLLVAIMWMFKSFAGKEPASLEGRTIDVGNVKVHVRNAIAEGGFSCIYVATDVVQPSKQYALKHVICNDDDLLDLITKEISVMKLLRGHPNVVALVAHTILDMGRRKEALLVMEFCEKSLATLLENRGSGYFEEKQVLLIFRDVCNAVYFMHSQSPPVAHRDLKAENVLLGPDGAWKLCDFGSTSTNHKCFDKSEEMGIEEDNIRKYTTPAYRAPEMWDLFRREVICEKVDIWALGCLLYRICFLKSAFDGESKLQVLNGNYRIPDGPKYSSAMTDLIKDMLKASPNARPDIMQVWFRVNELLPLELQKHLPDGSSGAVEMRPPPSGSQDQGVPRKTTLMPRRGLASLPSSRESEKEMRQTKPFQDAPKTGRGAIGAFWTTEHAKDSAVVDNKGPHFDELIKQSASTQNPNTSVCKVSPPRERHVYLRNQVRIEQGDPVKRPDERTGEDFEIKFFQEMKQSSNPEKKPASENETFNTFVADFDTGKLNSKNITSDNIPHKRELEAEVDQLKGQLKMANLEKAEITSRCEKLSSVCRSQRQEIQELKHALAAVSPSPPGKDSSKKHENPGSLQSITPLRMKIEGTVWELQQGMMHPSPSPRREIKTWNAFGATNGHQNVMSALNPSTDLWDFNLESFTASSGSQISGSSAQGNASMRTNSGATKKADANQPAGWAGF